MILGINDALSYERLVQDFPPRPIHNNQQLQAVQNRIDVLIDLERELTPDESDYLDIV